MSRRILFKVEKDRVLVPVGEPCPFGCRYCYTRGGEVGLARVEMEEVLSRFRKFALEASFETIQFGYDGDPFARPERGLAMLRQLALVAAVQPWPIRLSSPWTMQPIACPSRRLLRP